MLITSLLVFVKVLMEKKSASDLNLPDSFLKTSPRMHATLPLVCSAYLETRVLHQPHTESVPKESAKPKETAESNKPKETAEPKEPKETAESKEPISQAADSAVVPEAVKEVNELVEQAAQNQLSAEEIRQLDEMMRSQVNDMLEDILKDRRKTCGMWEEEEERVVAAEPLEEGDSDDSFDEKYLPRSSASLGGKEEELSVEEPAVEPAEEPADEVKEEKSEEKVKEEVKEEAKEEKPEEKKSPFLQLDKCSDEMMMGLMGMDLPEEEEDIIADTIVNAMKMEEKPEEKHQEKPQEEEVLTEVDDGEEKKPKKSSGLWCRS